MRRLLLLTTAAYWCTMFVLTHLPPRHMPKLRVSDKLEHLTAFMMLGGLLYLCLSPSVRRPILVAALIGAAYGAMDEWTQPLVGRSCEMLDWVSDVSGIILGAGCMAIALMVIRSPRTV
jgi:VanZ family protein